MKLSIPIFSFWILFFVQNISFGQQVDHWETVVYNSDSWRYFVGNSEPPTSWKSPGFNDFQWSLGVGGFGYGDDDDNTLIEPTVSVYFRKSFNVSDISKIVHAALHSDYDDGFVAYINGVEITRQNIGQPGIPPAHDDTANTWHEAGLYEGNDPELFIFPSSLLQSTLKEGENVLAIQVHNHDINSSDLSSNFFFSVGISDNSMTYRNTPEWFDIPLTSSNLPLIHITTTETSEIYDEPKVPAHMGIIDNGAGNRNHIFDEFNGYDGRISIEIRGASSQLFPKKGYGFETQNEVGDNLNVSLLGLPEENDWVLHGPYADKSLMRNVIAYHMGNSTGRYAPRTQYCELILNGDYRGVYMLTEKIKRDKNRVDIAKLTENDIEGDELTGGYIIQVDRDDESTDEDGWISNYPGYKFYGYVDPGQDELLPVQKEYIKGYFEQFEENMFGNDFEEKYLDFVDVSSYVDYFLITELGKHIDAYKLSFYMYKKKDSNGGKIHFGPLWDFNLAYGNFDFACSPDPDGWSYLFVDDCSSWLPFWVKTLTEIPQVSHETNCRWQELRNGPLRTDKLVQLIDSNKDLLKEGSVRNFERWPILGEYVWPNDYIGETYDEEVAFLKQWLLARLDWMDDNMIGNCDLFISDVKESNSAKIIVYPNPASDKINIDLENSFEENMNFQLFDMVGSKIMSHAISGTSITVSCKNITPGMYFYKITNATGQISNGKLNIID